MNDWKSEKGLTREEKEDEFDCCSSSVSSVHFDHLNSNVSRTEHPRRIFTCIGMIEGAELQRSVLPKHRACEWYRWETIDDLQHQVPMPRTLLCTQESITPRLATLAATIFYRWRSFPVERIGENRRTHVARLRRTVSRNDRCIGLIEWIETREACLLYTSPSPRD